MELIRGDSKPLRFKRTSKKDGEVITDLPDQLYFTVKYAYESKNPIFQKELNKDIKFNEEDNFYYFMINPEDTDNYPYRDYVYDIEVITKGFKQTIAIGELKLTEEVTHACNEHYENSDESIDIEDLTVEEIVTMEEYTPTYENTGTKDYEELENKPAIDGNELHAQTTSEELGLASDETVQKIDERLKKIEEGGLDIPIYVWNGKSSREDPSTIETMKNMFDNFVKGKPFFMIHSSIGSSSVNGIYILSGGGVLTKNLNDSTDVIFVKTQENLGANSSPSYNTIRLRIYYSYDSETGTFTYNSHEIALNGIQTIKLASANRTLLTTNTTEYTPTSDYHPATKKYVDDTVTSAITNVLEGEY